ncbi:MAG TPA: alpha/beta hydrolase [Dyella sp.]|nr:alpha/beta hydrolase [Dyella sp.]
MHARIVRLIGLLPILMLSGRAIATEAVTLHCTDNVEVHGTLSPARADNDKVLLLFHQAHANRHEYDPLIARFNQLGYDTLAIDQRSGGDLFGGHNRTVQARGRSADYLDALPDLDAALAWARGRHYGTIVAVGSSYSSALVIVLAARHPAGLSAIASFSPGEYFDDKNLIKRAAAKVSVPFYITTDPAEAGNVAEVLRDAHGSNIVHYRPRAGVHGASTLVQVRDPAGYAANLQSFEAFLATLGH